MFIEYKETVLNKESTHFHLRDYRIELQEEQDKIIVIGDLVIKQDEEIEILADSRYYPASKFNLKIEDLIEKY